jgi:hypothetical protein
VLGLAYPGNSSRHGVRSLVLLVVVARATTSGSARNSLRRCRPERMSMSPNGPFAASWRERLHPHRQTENKAREQVVGVG